MMTNLLRSTERQEMKAARSFVLVILASASLTACASSAAIAPTTTTTTVPPTTTSTTTVRQAVLIWYVKGGKDRLDSISSSLSALDASDIVNGCRQLQSDVEAAQQYGPIPAPAAQEPLGRALASYARFASDCIDGAETNSVTLLAQAREDMADANAALDQTTVAIRTATSS